MPGNLNLTTGAVQAILNDNKVDKPVLQILGVKRLANGDRYRLFLSDGAFVSSFAMVTSQLNHHFDNGSVDKFSVIRLNEYICNKTQVQDKTRFIIIIMDFELIANGSVAGDKIGNPVTIDSSSNSTTNNNNVSVSSNSMNTDVKRESSGFGGSRDAIGGGGGSGGFSRQPKPEPRRDSIQGAGKLVQPIMCVTPYQNRWTIKARVSSKSNVRTFTNSRGEGKLFSVDLIDDSGELRATAFGEQCDKYFNNFEVNKVYYISNGNLKPANKAFNKTNNDYEMSFNKETIVEPCFDDVAEVPMINFAFKSIKDLSTLAPNSFVDVIGICKQASDIQIVVARTTNRELKKRNLSLVDSSNSEISVTVWDKEAEEFDGSSNPVVAIKGAKISDFGGCSLTITHGSTMLIDPDIPECRRLKSWFQSEGHKTEYTSLSKSGGGLGSASNWKHLSDIKTESLGLKEKSDYMTAKVTVVMIKHENALYKACAEEQCKKKVIETAEGMYRCEKCCKESSSFKWIAILQVSVADYTDSVFVTCFQEASEKLLGKTVDEIAAVATENNGSISSLTAACIGKPLVLKLRISSEYYNDEQRVRVSAVEVSPVNFVECNKKLIARIKGMI
ncbi:Replication protein A 70 kDa DNA-binding subunit [Chamberlinius hualienensis]